ncbi:MULTISPECIES: undecaprenyl-diphosphate phosphatase [Cytobacillus]|jgi:undecaprenyl-diphosphatase|uniref:Undecaprenyl-diphosphatase n=1 Tax=Cytobacillus pseudoceanisediminis TaxID=3051614 RepID=A0ABZ2ZQL8_9BACI|nr:MULTISPECIES: undecaprenyl-diphosphate phosphatase [Cytobacillus]MBY0156242.1 undecaprenyl-diphosphate phosphatase [Cytobacillus firmus]MBU8728599.1 undecaprenyl-diphosphate phosphatase [Cytobacillus oceanisediminis]MCM3244145.1 undecaprenyl-diphosphate phosphatase [Cytobacillus oceanisediminis]MCM3392507.1 undecaprenyl-diphosphate phosphatase [Cytobacillus oceanisediminis]MCM3530889.1 undecaprenyl-diphosphate phosphatase [Cytobacillus oceanisediminis]
MDFIMILKAIILGFVEGMTEFAPVSSTGHMIIVDDMWLNTKEFLSKYEANTFKVVIQLGSILAVVIIFKERFMEMLGLGGRSKNSEEKQSRLKLSQVIVGLIPAGILGVLFEDYIDEHLFSTETVLIGLVIGAFLMIFADIFGGKDPKTVSVDQITYKQALSIGLIQCFSLWPGFSRSGSTISGGVLLGLSHRAAADFTFIMAVPIMAGASFLSLIKNLEYFSVDALPFFIAGFISAFVFALISIRFFLKMINKVKLIPFAIYRIVLAGVIYFIFF